MTAAKEPAADAIRRLRVAPATVVLDDQGHSVRSIILSPEDRDNVLAAYAAIEAERDANSQAYWDAEAKIDKLKIALATAEARAPLDAADRALIEGPMGPGERAAFDNGRAIGRREMTARAETAEAELTMIAERTLEQPIIEALLTEALAALEPFAVFAHHFDNRVRPFPWRPRGSKNGDALDQQYPADQCVVHAHAITQVAKTDLDDDRLIIADFRAAAAVLAKGGRG